MSIPVGRRPESSRSTLAVLASLAALTLLCCGAAVTVLLFLQAARH